MLEAPQVLGSAELHYVKAAKGPAIPAGCAFDFEGGFEADEVGCRADMFGGHAVEICRAERLGNIAGR